MVAVFSNVYQGKGFFVYLSPPDNGTGFGYSTSAVSNAISAGMKNVVCILFTLLMLISCSHRSNDPAPDCDIDASPCMKFDGERYISLEIEPRPVKAMSPLYFRVRLKNHRKPKDIIIDLSMPNMSMGFNKVPLERSGKDTYDGQGFIPVCPSGKRLWRAGVIIDGRLEETFSFNVH